MANEMVIPMPKGIDLSTPTQKIVAAILLLGSLFILNKLLPIVVIVAVLGWKAAFLIIPMAILIHQRERLWLEYKKFVYRRTKKLIGYDPIGELEVCYDWILAKYTKGEATWKKALGICKTEAYNLEILKAKRDNNAREADILEGAKDPSYKVLAGKALTDDRMLKTRQPKYDNLAKQAETLAQIVQEQSIFVETTRYNIDALKQEWEASKAMDEVVTNMNEFISTDTENARRFKDAVDITRNQIMTYAANLEVFEEKTKPLLQVSKAKNAVAEADSQAFLDEWRKTAKIEKVNFN